MARNKQLQSQEIEFLLQQLGEELAKKGLTSPIRVLVIGGAYMLLHVGNRPTTQDIDIFPLNFADSSHPDKTTRVILAAIRAVATNHGLKRDWFNDAAYGILGGIEPAQEQLSLWRTFGPLQVYMPPAQFILATKLFGYRDRDYNDVLALLAELGVTRREQAQAIVDTYIDRQTQREYNTHVTLDELFDE
jgi:hypothetical protein